jgi:hypothetical protein
MKQSLESVKSILALMTPKMGHKYELTDDSPEEHSITFEVDRIAFTIVQNNDTEFELYIWNRTHGSRENPPEDYETSVAKSPSIYNLVGTVYRILHNDKIQYVMESVVEELFPLKE